MDRFLRSICWATLAASMALAQQPNQEPPNHVAFVRHILTSIADPSHDPAICKMNEQAVVSLYGLNEQEAPSLHSTGQSFAAAIRAFRDQEATLLAGKTTLTDSDRASVASLSSQLDQTVASFIVQLLNSLRPQTATRLRQQADLVAQYTETGQKGN